MHVELIIMSTAGTAMLLVMQCLEFMRAERSRELAARIRPAVRRLVRSPETLTVTVPIWRVSPVASR